MNKRGRDKNRGRKTKLEEERKNKRIEIKQE